MKTLKQASILIVFLILSLNLSAQPDPPSSGHGQSGDQPNGGGAPIGGGLLILLGLGAGYGAKKLYRMGKEGLEE